MTTGVGRARRLFATGLWALGMVLAGCSAPTRVEWVAEPSPAEPLEGLAESEVAEDTLNAALDEVWELQMTRYPTWATYEGDRRYDDRLTDLSPAAEESHLQALEAAVARVEALDPGALSPMSRDTRAMLIDDVRRRREQRVCRFEWWSVDGLGGPQVDWPMLPVFHSIRGRADVETLQARYLATAPQMLQRIANLREGLARGYTPARLNVARAIRQIEALLATPLDDDPMLVLQPVDEGATYDVGELRRLVEEVVRPSLEAYLDVLRVEVLPVARVSVGVSALPDGEACYEVLMRQHIGEGHAPEELHRTGLEVLEWAESGMLATARELGFDVATPAEAMAAMESDPAQVTHDEGRLRELNEVAVQRAWEALPEAFGRLPETPVMVRPMEAHRAADAPAAYYYSAPEDGSRPAYYYVNLHEPSSRPLYNLEALAFHEAVPGHHLQIALAQELPDVHIWRRNAGQTAFVEGWALYAEVLADELGLYSSPATRFGMYNYQAWRAVRLVVDTGMHHFGWSREQALAFMLEHTALTGREAANEIDRYIAWPGQALAYLVGRLEIESLRAEAQRALGEAFDRRAFHDAVLGGGAVPLAILRQNMRAWLASEVARASSPHRPGAPPSLDGGRAP